jgi:hypothetical protein
MNDSKGIEPIFENSSPAMPKVFNIEYTVSIYIIIVPKITSIHAASLILGQRKIAKKVANAPKTSWLEIYSICPASMLQYNFFFGK